MYGQSSSVQRNIGVGSAANRHLTLIESNRHQKKVVLHVKDLSKSKSVRLKISPISLEGLFLRLTGRETLE